MLTEIIIFALFAVSYNLLLGYAGLLSFGHALFFGFGAFTTAISTIHIPGASLLLVVLISAVATLVVGLIVGSLLLRHKGAYFALLTLAFNSIFYAVAVSWDAVTGGDDGLSITRPALDLGFRTISTDSITQFYYVTLVIVGGILVYCWYFTNTAMGKTLLLMRENEERMKFLGYDTNISRLILFAFTGTLAGIAGSMYAFNFQFVSISAISIDMTTAVLLMTFVGGTGGLWGPILGALVYLTLQHYLSDFTDRWQIFMGLIFIGMVIFIPGGLYEMISKIGLRLAGIIKNKMIKTKGAEERAL